MHTGMPRVLWTCMLKCSLVAERASVASAPTKATPLPLLCSGIVERGAEGEEEGPGRRSRRQLAATPHGIMVNDLAMKCRSVGAIRQQWCEGGVLMLPAS